MYQQLIDTAVENKFYIKINISVASDGFAVLLD